MRAPTARPGEFYQLDFEMSFVTQDDVFAAIEPVLHGVFEEFADWQGKGRSVSRAAVPRIPYRESMLKYGNDKPDLRNPILITDVSRAFQGLGLRPLRLDRRGRRRRPRDPGAEHRREEPQVLRRHERLGAVAKASPASAMRRARAASSAARSPRTTARTSMTAIADALGLGPDDGIFFAAGKEAQAAKLAGLARTRVAEQLGLIDAEALRILLDRRLPDVRI